MPVKYGYSTYVTRRGVYVSGTVKTLHHYGARTAYGERTAWKVARYVSLPGGTGGPFTGPVGQARKAARRTGREWAATMSAEAAE